MYAIIEDSGSQLKAQVGDVLEIDLRELADNASSLTFERVLMVGSEKAPRIGAPYLSGVTVTAEILEREVKGEKLDIRKYRRRKNYRRKMGHRQRHMTVKVTAING